MALDLNDTDLMRAEIEAGEQKRTDHLQNYKKLIEQYCGETVSGEYGRWVLNLTFEYLSYMVPTVCFENPIATISSRKQPSASMIGEMQRMVVQQIQLGLMAPEQGEDMLGSMRQPELVARGVQHALNRWIRDEGYDTTLDRIAYDTLMAFGVTLTRLAPMPGHPERRWPSGRRISPQRFCMDPNALHAAETRWRGHWSYEDKEDMVKIAEADAKQPEGQRAGWDLEAIRKLEPGRDDEKGLQRKEVKVYNIWSPEPTPDLPDGADERLFHGALVSYAGCRNAENITEMQVIRKARPYHGPRSGPYSLFGSYVVPDNVYPMSPLLATFVQHEELQKHAQSMSHNAAQYKRIVLVSDKNPKLAQDIKDKPDMFVVLIEDETFDKNQVVVIEVAGVSDQQMKHFGMLRDRWERVIGMDAAASGRVEGESTATENAIADESRDLRGSYIIKRFQKCTTDDLKLKTWYMVNDERFELELGPEAGEDLDMLQPLFRGDPKGDTIYEDLELVIEPSSMERSNRPLFQVHVMQAFKLILQAAPAMVQYPFVKWKNLIRQIGNSLNLPNLDQAVNFDMVQQFAAMAQQMGMGQPQSTYEDSFRRREGLEGPSDTSMSKRSGGFSAESRGSMNGVSRGARARTQ